MSNAVSKGLPFSLYFLVAVLAGCIASSSVIATPLSGASSAGAPTLADIHPARLTKAQSLTFSPTSVQSGTNIIGTITLSSVASTNAAVALMSSDPAVSVPSSVTVLAGKSSATFTITAPTVTASTSVSITATFRVSVMKTFTITPAPPKVSGLTLSPDPVTGGTVSKGTVALNGPAPAGGSVVSLMSSDNAAAMPASASVAVVAGATTANFNVNTFTVGVATPVTITATLSGTASSVLTVDPASTNFVTHLYFNPPTVVGGTGGSSTGTVILNAPAMGAVTVTLGSSNASVTVPSSITIPNGTTTATITATTKAVSSPTVVTVTASLGGALNNTLRVNPALTAPLTEHIIVAGETTSPDFPATANAFQPMIDSTDSGWAGSFTMTTQTNGALTASKNFVTYFGMTGTNAGTQVRDSFVDALGNVYICGVTSDNTLPTTTGVAQPSFAGAYHDGFVAKFGPLGNLLAVTYIGGGTGPAVTGKTTGETAETICYNMFVDSSGFVYVGGRTSTSDLLTVISAPAGSFQRNYGGGSPNPSHWGGDFWIAKLNPDFKGTVWATYVGGLNDDGGRGRLAVDSAGNVIIGGFGQSKTNFPVPSGKTLPNLSNTSNFGAVVKISADGSKLLYTSILTGNVTFTGSGQTSTNASGGIIIDSGGNAYTCGFTTARDLISFSGVPPTGFQTVAKGNVSAYVAKISPTGQFLAMTLIGGSGTGGKNSEECKALAFDSEGNVLMYTPTSSPDYPVTSGAFQTTLVGQNNLGITKFTPDLTHVIFSTYVGGSGHEDMDAGRLELDVNENIWFSFLTTSTDLLTTKVVTPNAVQTTFLGPGVAMKTCTSLPGYSCSDVAFAKLSADGKRILFGSYIGGNNQDNPRTMRYHKN